MPHHLILIMYLVMDFETSEPLNLIDDGYSLRFIYALVRSQNCECTLNDGQTAYWRMKATFHFLC